MAELVLEQDATVFAIEGITCMDCARKFEQAVNALPGVNKAMLNAMTGKLTVYGKVDLKALQELGREEDYTVTPAEGKACCGHEHEPAGRGELYRAIIAGIALAAAYLTDYMNVTDTVFLPLYVAAMIFGGWDNFKKAGRSLAKFNFNMSVLMTAAVIGAFAIGEYSEGATVAFLFAVSEMLEAWTLSRARKSIRDLMDIAPKSASVRRDGEERQIAVDDILVGDIMIVRPGEKIAMDGVIVDGETAINQAAITGEAIPVEKGPGAEIYAGTLNTYGSLEVKVTKLVQDATIAKIIHMVEQAQGKRAPLQTFIEKFAAVYTPIVIALAVGIIFVPPVFLGQEWVPWIYRGLSLMVVACPCALVVSTPVAIVSAISNAARNGVLIKGGVYLEEAGALKAVAFDKTGTLTEGKPAVTDIIPVGQRSKEQLLVTAASLEARSEHPLAAAIVQSAELQGLKVMPAGDFAAITGRGAKGTVAGETVYIGSPRLFTDQGIVLGPVVCDIDRLQNEGKTVMLVGSDHAIYGLLAVADQIRAAGRTVVTALKQAGIERTVLLTGDNAAAAKAVATVIGIDDFRAELLPEDKVGAVEELLKRHGRTAMIGDGINDAPALATATVGIAMGGAGTDTALETADIVLMADDLTKLPFTVRLSRKAVAIIRQNIAFALFIKTVAVLAVFPGWLTLWLAILADMGATILVTLNSIRLLGVKAGDQ